MKQKMKQLFIAYALIIPLIFIIIIWGYSFIRNEFLTNKYYADFEYAYQANSMLGEMEYFKVLNCDDSTAQVYYVSKNKRDANVLSFEKIAGKWVEKSWNTIWSTSGSASDTIWPYWWHFIYGGL